LRSRFRLRSQFFKLLVTATGRSAAPNGGLKRGESFDPDGFFSGVLARLQARLDALGARRLRDEDGYEYWDLKPDWRPGDVIEL
jgi:hypothetical protein